MRASTEEEIKNTAFLQVSLDDVFCPVDKLVLLLMLVAVGNYFCFGLVFGRLAQHLAV
jgi:hypothetical protein